MTREQTETVDRLTKELKPTASGFINFRHLMEYCESAFKSNGWDWSAYVAWATKNYYEGLRIKRGQSQGAE